MERTFLRTTPLIGEQGLQKLAGCCVAVFGLGGVGSFVVEILARAGIGKLILIDGDIIEESNINRQLFALHSTVGIQKTEAARRRVLDINPSCVVHTIPRFIRPTTDTMLDDTFFNDPIDYFADALDTVSTKIALAAEAQNRNIPCISAMGCANRLNASKLQIDDIYTTAVCPLCRVMRRELKKRQITSLQVLYSREPPKKTIRGEPLASVPWVPSTAGILMAEHIITGLLNA